MPLPEKKDRNFLVVFLKDVLSWSLYEIANILEIDYNNMKKVYKRDKDKYQSRVKDTCQIISIKQRYDKF
jgi:hypothetical protein